MRCIDTDAAGRRGGGGGSGHMHARQYNPSLPERRARVGSTSPRSRQASPCPHDVADAAADPDSARRRRGGRRHLPARSTAADSRLSAGRHRSRSQCARMGPCSRRNEKPRRIRHRVPDVLDRPRVQSAAVAIDARRGVRARLCAGRDHDDRRDARALFSWLRVARRSRARRRARYELDGHRLEDARREDGARHTA